MTFRDALSRSGVPFRTSTTDPSEITLCCPFCSGRGESSDTRFRLGVNTQTGLAHCFNCGWKSHSSLRRILSQLGSREVVDTSEPSLEEKPESKSPICLPADFSVLTQCYDESDKEAIQYLLKRGVTRKQIQQNQIGVSCVGQYAHRIVFPVWEGKNLRGFVARDLTGRSSVRYLNSVGDKYLYNYQRPAPKVLLSEGIFKALRLERAVHRVRADFQSMALLGHDITDTQLDQLDKAKCEKVVLWPDPDTVGRRGMVKVAYKLAEAGIQVWIQKDARVPADVASIETLQRLLHKQHFAPYEWRTLPDLW